MSPFAITLRTLRLNRSLLQKDAAALLGYEQSFISGLERGLKSPPKSGFINQVATKYELTEVELDALTYAMHQSKRSYSLPKGASLDAYEIFRELEKQINDLGQNQLKLIRLALGIEMLQTNNIQNTLDQSRLNEMEESKM
jgi:transcriptional regulator with XRE-family HTH domain